MTEATRQSFVPGAAESPFPIQNLPYGCFRTSAGEPAHLGVAIGDQVLDLTRLEQAGKLPTDGHTFQGSTLNTFLAQGQTVWTKVRARLTELLDATHAELRDDVSLREQVLVSMAQVELLLPVNIGDYTDFYSSMFHARNVGTMLRGPDNALQANWTHLPVAYHGRASSVVISGTDIRRPLGQTGEGKFGPAKALDFELEVGFLIGPGNPLGEPIPITKAMEHIFGLVLVNDWSARDIQKWEYVPLGPFLAKSFATSISPWIVPLAALEPFRLPPSLQDPKPLPYLFWQDDHTYDIELEVTLAAQGGNPMRITQSNFRYLYWTMAQQLAHHTSNGCNVCPGDLLASGTISGPDPESRGCLLELTWGGKEPLTLPDEQTRHFLQDGDRVTMTAACRGNGYRIGFGEVSGQILPALPRPE